MQNTILQDVISRLQSAVVALQKKITAMQRHNTHLQEKIAALETDVQRLTLENHTLQTTLDDVDKQGLDTQYIQGELNAIIEEVEKLHHAMTHTHADGTHADAAHADGVHSDDTHADPMQGSLHA